MRGPGARIAAVALGAASLLFASCDSAESTSAGTGGSGGTSGGTGGSTGQSGADTGGSAGSTATGGTAGGGVGAGMGGQAGEAGGAGMAGSGGASGSGDAGMGGMGPVTCDPEDLSPGCVLKTTGAIFVAPSAQGGDDAHDGTQGAPVLTVTKAIALAAGVNIPIYICAGTYKEHVEVTADNIALRGGFTCDASVWTYDRGKRARIAPSTKDEALRVKDVTGLEVTDLELVSANATTPGASSVAIFVSGSEDVVFTRLHVVAGNGADGEDGVLEGFAYAAQEKLKGIDATSDEGADAKECDCDDTGLSSRGAAGGDGGQDGGGGEPDLGGGSAGVHGSACSNGGLGLNATAAPDGPGAQSHGAVESETWIPASGEEAANGTPGQGGGGGGGGATSGDGGGGGGACGGCGGKGGPGGKGGGGSLAILSVDSKLSIGSCVIETGDGGNGGNGAAGQLGQVGGIRGAGYNAACLGGNGGTGGDGGGGGGGAGGISVGIVSTMSTVSVDTRTLITPGTAGEGGMGGGDLNNGIVGVAQTQLVL